MEASIQAERNKALKKICQVMKDTNSYCWQEETLNEWRACEVQLIVEQLDKTILRIKEKYKRRQKCEQ